MGTTAYRLLGIAGQQFAKKGYSGTSMRSIARETGTTQAAIYHHFPNKEALYQAVLEQQFQQTTSDMFERLTHIEDPLQRIEGLVMGLADLVADDEQFRQLYFRELLEGDEERLSFLAHQVFGSMATLATSVVEDLNLEMDSYQVLLSIAGLVYHHVEARKLIKHLPDSRPENRDMKIIVKHIIQLLTGGLK